MTCSGRIIFSSELTTGFTSTACALVRYTLLLACLGKRQRFTMHPHFAPALGFMAGALCIFKAVNDVRGQHRRRVTNYRNCSYRSVKMVDIKSNRIYGQVGGVC